MADYYTPLEYVTAGGLLLLGGDPLLEERVATTLFREPGEVLAVRRGKAIDEMSFLRRGGTIVLRARGWGDREGREIGLEVTSKAGRVLVLFPDDRHPVAGVGSPEPLEARRYARATVDPTSGDVHEGGDLSAYRLRAFWRDASVVWCALPSAWIERPGRHHELLLFEASGGVGKPDTTDLEAAEERFHEEVSIRTATLAWEAAAVLAHGADRIADAALGSVLHQLVDAFGTPAALRSAALDWLDARLASVTDRRYFEKFRGERDLLAAESAARWKKVGRRG